MFKNIAKGMLIGISCIVPGVSGGTMAVSMGIYDRLISCISHFFRDIKENIRFLIPIIIGMCISVVASVFGIDYLFEEFPFATNLLFSGLVLGSLPTMYSKVKNESIKKGHLITFILFFAMIIVMAALSDTKGTEVVFEKNFSQIVLLFIVGIIGSATMVIPGVSGSMILLLIGYYNPLLTVIKDFLSSALSFDIGGMFESAYILAPFGIGIVFGGILIAKLIEVIFNRFPIYAYWAIIALLIASPIGIMMVGNYSQMGFVTILSGVVAFVAGFFIAGKLGEK